MDNYESLRRTKLRCKQAGSARYEVGSLRSWRGRETPSLSTSKRPMPTSPSTGRGTTASRATHSSLLIARRTEPELSSDTHLEGDLLLARQWLDRAEDGLDDIL